MCSALSMLIAIGAGEVSYRLYHWLKYGDPLFSTPEHLMNLHHLPTAGDDYLGWRAMPNYRVVTTIDRGDGKPYSVNVTQNDHGFRLFGDLRTANPTIMVVGDSFTQASEVSDDQTYYSVVKDLLNVEIFAYGASAYGTLQEYMILDTYIDRIHPDVILWQYCSNDLADNIPELATDNFVDYRGWVRPYWVNGHVEYIAPRPYSRHLRRFALLHSRLLFLVTRKFDAIFNRYRSPDELLNEIRRHPAFSRAIQVTDELMGKVKSRARKTPIVAFGCDDVPHYVKAFSEISAHHGIIFLEGVARSLRHAEENGTVVTGKDHYHWNEVGHRIAGEVIADYLRKSSVRFASWPDQE